MARPPASQAPFVSPILASHACSDDGFSCYHSVLRKDRMHSQFRIDSKQATARFVFVFVLFVTSFLIQQGWRSLMEALQDKLCISYIFQKDDFLVL